MFRIAICDDEEIYAEKIFKHIDAYMRQQKLPYEIDIFHSGKELMSLGVEMMKYKVVFLDINMEEVDGLATAGGIRQYSKDMFIVFVTAYITYALEGYKFNAVRFILKETKMFSEAIRECMDDIFEKMNHVSARKDISFCEGRKVICLDRLLFIESKLHKLEFHIMEEQMQVYTLNGTLNGVEDEYLPYQFIRIHQSYLVNMRHIRQIQRYEVVLSNGECLSVPKARYPYVEDQFISYKGEM
ncbi:MAG: LytTR family DNA-binding domain-containing protein [Lachnospiraceae bacterium]|nr:LytTR family DNA-binding domain-containing protein [Lachnospiraceae bacterium]